MKKNILLLSICTLMMLSGCNNTSSSSNNISSNNSSSINEIILGVEINGAKSCMVGKTIRLIADVLGSENDDVIWTSNNTNIASIDEEGIVTGISEGEVEIKATSKIDDTKFATTSISITLPKATEITVEVEESDNITYDAKTKTYSIPLGQTFYVNSIFENVKVPDVSYSITYPSGTSEETTVKLELIENTTRAKVIAYAAMEGLIITATGKYSDLATGNLINSVKINIIDINNDNYLNAKETINSFKEKEISSLLSSNIKRTKEVTSNNETYKEVHEIEHNSFINASYINKTISSFQNNTLDEENKYYYYQGYNTIDMKDNYYTFEYDKNEYIKNIYTPTNNKENISLMFDINTNITYGHYGLLNNIFGDSNTIFDGSISTLGNIYIYAYANYEITSNSIKITSTCFDEDYSLNYKFDFELNYSGTSISDYTLTQEISNETTTIKYSEVANNFVYGTKVEDNESNNENYLDINKYYITEFEVNEFKEKDQNGTYDYSDQNKYGADVVTTENGLTKYIATYDKTIVLKVNALSPTTANVNFDTVTAISSDTSSIPSVTSFKDGIFAINAKKDDSGISKPGKATFTFKTSLGYEEKVIIEFTETVLKSVNVNFGNEGPTYDSSNDTYVFDSIYINEYSNYFFINTDPDEDIYEFDIDIIEGNKDGISLFEFDDTNIYGYPGFSYGINGLVAGTYKFKIYVKDYNVYDQKTFEITILEPLSNETIEKGIVGNSYEYTGFSIMTSIFTFTSNTLITYTETSLDSTITSTFNYKIENGKIVISEIQNFTTGSYFSRINKGIIEFDSEFKNLKFHLEIYDENKLEGMNFFQYYNYTFAKEDLKSSDFIEKMNDVTLKSSDNPFDTVYFKDGKGTLTICNYSGTKLATITFDISYNESSNLVIFSNATTSNSNYTLETSSCEFDEGLQRVVLKVGYDRYYFNLS